MGCGEDRSLVRERRRRCPRRSSSLLAGVLLVAVMLSTACSGGRSTEAFCSTLGSEKERIRGQLDAGLDAMESQEDDFAKALVGVGATMQSVGELRTYFDKLARVAPEEIRVEAEIVAEEMANQTRVPELSLEGLASSLLGGVAISGQLESLDRYARQHCGESI